jgi:hypothetical protein
MATPCSWLGLATFAYFSTAQVLRLQDGLDSTTYFGCSCRIFWCSSFKLRSQPAKCVVRPRSSPCTIFQSECLIWC